MRVAVTCVTYFERWLTPLCAGSFHHQVGFHIGEWYKSSNHRRREIKWSWMNRDGKPIIWHYNYREAQFLAASEALEAVCSPAQSLKGNTLWYLHVSRKRRPWYLRRPGTSWHHGSARRNETKEETGELKGTWGRGQRAWAYARVWHRLTRQSVCKPTYYTFLTCPRIFRLPTPHPHPTLNPPLPAPHPQPHRPSSRLSSFTYRR